jgi:hypothetical protein
VALQQLDVITGGHCLLQMRAAVEPPPGLRRIETSWAVPRGERVAGAKR